MKILHRFNTILTGLLVVSSFLSCNHTPEKKDVTAPPPSQPTGIKAIVIDERKALEEERNKLRESIKETQKQLQDVQKKAKDASRIVPLSLRPFTQKQYQNEIKKIKNSKHSAPLQIDSVHNEKHK